MKRLSLILFCLLCAKTVFALNCQGDKMANYWCWPTGTSNIGNMLRWHGKNPNYDYTVYGVHLGIDIRAKEGNTVYAISDGKVLFSSMDRHGYGGVAWNDLGGALIVEHYDSESNPFTVLYGHVKDIRVEQGKKIVRGQEIAKIGPYNGGDTHLHFGIRFPANNDGYRYTGYGKKDYGFVDPLYFFSAHFPLMEFLYVSEVINGFSGQEYGIGWWPRDVTCEKAEIWTEDQYSFLLNTDKAICKDAYDILEQALIWNGAADRWKDAFFGEELNISKLQCKAR